MWFPFGFALLVAIGAAVLLRRRGKQMRLSLFFLAGMPTGPSGMPGLAWMFPGTGTPADPDTRAPVSGPANPHESVPPAGVAKLVRKRLDDE
jgi:hypothetical protein